MRTATKILSITASGTNVYRSAPCEIAGELANSIQARWAAGPVGAFKVYVSDIFQGTEFKTVAQSFSDGEWVELPTGGGSSPSGTAGGDMWRLGTLEFRWVIFEYTNASGTGLIEAWLHGKKI